MKLEIITSTVLGFIFGYFALTVHRADMAFSCLGLAIIFFAIAIVTLFPEKEECDSDTKGWVNVLAKKEPTFKAKIAKEEKRLSKI